MYRVLSLDGGGIRGLFTAELLDRLVRQHPPLLRRIDLIGGTSTGGILALGLAAGHSPRRLADFYYQRARQVFAQHWVRRLRPLRRLVRAQYPRTGLESLLAEVLGDLTLADLTKRVVISSYDLARGHPANGRPKFFHNFDPKDGVVGDGHERAADVALRTSAAPLLFPSYQGYIDGGVVANNPAMCTLAQALHPGSAAQTLSQVALLSVGTGSRNFGVPGETHDWGISQWALPILTILMEGVSEATDYECKQLLGARYLRLNPLLPEICGLDAVHKIDELVDAARTTDLAPTLNWLARWW